MLSKLLLAFFTVLLTSGTSIAQQYNFKRFSVEEGLPRSGVFCMLEDSRGFLWVGTEGGGLARFDGRSFVTFSTETGLPDNTVRALFEDSNGHLWIATDGHGLCRYDGRTFKTFTVEHGLSSDHVRCMAQDSQGDLWIGTFGGGINRLHFKDDSLQVTVFDASGPLRSNNVRTCLTDSDGKLWFGTDGGLCSTNGSDWIFLDTADGLPDSRVLVLYEDGLKNLWVGTEKGVAKRTKEGFQVYSVADGLISNRIRGICQDDLGNMWFGTQDGVSRFNGTGFLSFVEKNGLSNNRIRHILKDRSGNLWFGTYFGGICRFSGEEFIHFRQWDGLSSNQVLSVFQESENTVWAGTLDGVTLIQPHDDGTYGLTRNPVGAELSGHSVHAIVRNPNGQVWFGTDHGILIKENNRASWFKADGEVFGEHVKVLLFDADGSVWVGTMQGVIRFANTGNGFVFDQYHSNPDIIESEVSSLLRDEFGRMWIGYLKAEVIIFNGKEFQQPELPAMLTDVSSIVQGPYGNIWIATEGGGLFRHLPSSGPISSTDFEHFGLKEGLSSSDLHLLVFDVDKNLWVGTASGIDKLELNNRAQVKNVTHFGPLDGFIGTETNENAPCLDNRGNLWFGTIRGLTRHDPSAQHASATEVRLHITEVRLGFDHSDWNSSELANGTGGHFQLPNGLKLPFAQNNLTITFNGIDLRAPEKVRYQWRLKGYNDEWSQAESNPTVNLTNIPPGSYEFMVRAGSGAGIWNELPVTFPFTVLPPFYLTWWFITLAALILVAVIFGIVKLREKQLLADKERLQRKVDERTLELRQEKERSDELLLNILPLETAEELKAKGFASVQLYDRVSVLFTDFVGFTNITEGLTHQELVHSLDEHFRMFDEVMDRYGIEKIKTIGDAYMAAGGIPGRNETNPMAVVAAGLEMIQRLKQLNRTKELKGEKAWLLRLGIHTGSVISGVVGKNKFAFDIWGDAVNTAARMESSGEVMKVNVSGSTYKWIRDHFECTPRGKIKAKNKGEIEMYFVDRLKPEYSETEDGLVPNVIFMELIRSKVELIPMLN